jgi:hypothetical protein
MSVYQAPRRWMELCSFIFTSAQVLHAARAHGRISIYSLIRREEDRLDLVSMCVGSQAKKVATTYTEFEQEEYHPKDSSNEQPMLNIYELQPG